MGYITTRTNVLIDLRTSAIGDVGTAFMQNGKDVGAYPNRIGAGELPVARGHLLTPEDGFWQRQILTIMCRFRTSRADETLIRRNCTPTAFIEYNQMELFVRPAGMPFLRNIAMVFDARLHRQQRSDRLFSQTI